MKRLPRMSIYPIIIIGVLLILTNSCNKDDDSNPVNTVTDIDGNIYHTVEIGTQVWMVENLKVTHYRNGDAIPNIIDNNQWNNSMTGAYRDYDDTASNSIAYGRLYNFYTIVDSRNLCPSGWHVPTDIEWRTLREYLGGISAGGMLKDTSTNYWQSPNTGATNYSGFTALPGGQFDAFRGEFSFINSAGFWWSSTEIKPYYAACWVLQYDSQNMTSSNNGMFAYFGISVRCVKD